MVSQYLALLSRSITYTEGLPTMPLRWTWTRMEESVQITGSKKTYSEADFRWAASELKLSALPPSYIELMTRFGMGEWHPDFFICVPRDPVPHATLAGSIAAGFESAETLIAGGVAIPDPDKFRRLLVFGFNGSGFSLGWDPTEQDATGEMPLYMTDRDYLKLIPVGRDLLEFIGDYWIDRRIETAYPLRGDGWEPQPIFRAGW